MAKDQTLILSNSTILGMLNDSKLLKSFPELRRAASTLKQKKGCKCRGVQKNGQNQAINSMKAMLRNWPEGQKAKLKKALGADKLQFFVGKTKVLI